MIMWCADTALKSQMIQKNIDDGETKLIQNIVTLAEMIVRSHLQTIDVKQYFLGILGHGRLYMTEDEQTKEVIIYKNFTQNIESVLLEDHVVGMELWKKNFITLKKIYEKVTVGHCILSNTVYHLINATYHMQFLPSPDITILKNLSLNLQKLLKLSDVFNLLFNNSYFLKLITENRVDDVDFFILLENSDILHLIEILLFHFILKCLENHQ